MVSSGALVTAVVALTGVLGGNGSHLSIPLKRGMTSARRRQLEDEGYTELASIKREPDGVYWSELNIGSPPQLFSVIVDTGSSTIAVPCSGCNCGRHNHFDITQSANVNVFKTRYTQCYSEGSCNRGSYVQAPMCLGENCDVEREGVPHRFGCCTTFASAFIKQEADGIIGMSGSTGTLLADLRSHHKLERDIFSLCLSASLGVLGVGGYDGSRHMEPIQWMPMEYGEFYRVKVENLYIDGTQVTHGGPLTPIVDSGTTFTYVPNNVFVLLKAAFDKFCNASPDNCPGTRNPTSALSADRRDALACFEPDMAVRGKDLAPWLEKFPSIEMEFEAYNGKKARVCIPPKTYFFLSGKSAYCVGLLQGVNKFVLGAITMAGFDLIFDHEHSRVGMARSICNPENDFDKTLRTSTSSCCGSCRLAQDAGFVPEAAPKSAEPKANTHQATKAPTEAPTFAIPHKTKTHDGKFYVANELPAFPKREVLIPVPGSGWESSTFSFQAKHVLFIDAGVASLCDGTARSFTFHPESLVYISGHDTHIKLGTGCKFGFVEITDGAYVETLPPSDAHAKPARDRNSVTILKTLVLGRAEFVVAENSGLAFNDQANLTSAATTTMEMSKNSFLFCAPVVQKGIEFPRGHLTVRGSAVSDCHLSVGALATMQIVPDKSKNKPFHSMNSLRIKGTLSTTISRDPFYTFNLLIDGALIWDHRTISTFRVEFEEGEASKTVTDLPEKARLITVSSHGSIQDLPTRVQLPPEFLCSGAVLDDGKIEQIVLPTQDCFNRCSEDLDSHKNGCDETSLRYDGSGGAASSQGAGAAGGSLVDAATGGEGEGENSALSGYYKGITNGLGISDPSTKHSVAGGVIAGTLTAALLYLVLYPPACIRDTCCVFCSRNEGYDSL